MWNYNGMGYPNNGYPGGQLAPMSNKIVVTSLQDALSRYADFNSDMAYWDVDKNVIYNVYTNVRGEKQYEVFTITKQSMEQPKSNTQYDDLLAKINEIGKKVDDLYGKYNVKQSSTNTTNSTNEKE